tara:strand:+ start:87 stop:731 length:645 start_codon:yes stop_codon:yes gene_type:complete
VSENLRKLIGVAVMAAIVVIGVVATNGDDSDFARTRNNAFGLPKGAGLDAQIQQPGDAENDLVIAMAAAAKCDEGHVLISTGDPVSPWRCGPLLSEITTTGELQAVADAPFGETSLSIMSGNLDIPCYYILSFDIWSSRLREQTAFNLHGCLNNWAIGRHVNSVEQAIEAWENHYSDSYHDDPCSNLFRDMTLETRGDTVTRLVAPPLNLQCDD